ncbi:hypothetical protein [Hyalangium versicolor]|uniref:hypothetical protein n=1 Tax=Hyalangium versicolor TaxID=2861190 RepID=UPI001CD007F0|nr:hypothetical protein [Hyalangium versicolor]
MNYFERIKPHLLPASVEQKEVAEALKEWVYRGESFILDARSGTCELCGQQDLSFHFAIDNRHNQNRLLIGSECIKRFDISVQDALGIEVVGRKAHQKVDADRRELENQARLRRVLNVLVQLARKPRFEEDINVESFAMYYRKNGAFTPRQLFLILWQVEKYGVPYRKTDFKVKLRSEREKEQIAEMSPERMKLLWPAMTPAQRKRAEEARSRMNRLPALGRPAPGTLPGIIKKY